MSELQTPVVDPPFTSGTNGSVPDTIRLHPAARTYSLPAPTHRAFRRNFFDRKDPFEGAGHLVRHFTFSNSYDLDGTAPGAVADEIKERLNQQLADGNLAETRLSVIDFDDAGVPGEPPRRFFVTQTTTRRNTVITVNTFFRAYGDHLYYSVRSYILPVLSIWKLFLAAVAIFHALVLTSLVPFIFKPIILGGILFHLHKFIIDLLAGDSFTIALRKQYPGGLNSGAFDDDDATAFLKTNVSLTLSTIATVLEKHDIDTGGLRMIVQRMEINNVSTNGGSIIGAAIGGIASRIAAEVRT